MTARANMSFGLRGRSNRLSAAHLTYHCCVEDWRRSSPRTWLSTNPSVGSSAGHMDVPDSEVSTSVKTVRQRCRRFVKLHRIDGACVLMSSPFWGPPIPESRYSADYAVYMKVVYYCVVKSSLHQVNKAADMSWGLQFIGDEATMASNGLRMRIAEASRSGDAGGDERTTGVHMDRIPTVDEDGLSGDEQLPTHDHEYMDTVAFDISQREGEGSVEPWAPPPPPQESDCKVRLVVRGVAP
eukprot:3574565-Pyramimonas_sp.AAC.2